MACMFVNKKSTHVVFEIRRRANEQLHHGSVSLFQFQAIPIAKLCNRRTTQEASH